MPIKVLMSKMGIDGHDRGIKVICYALRQSGMEVIYTGAHRKPEDVMKAAIEEDVDLIGVSTLGGDHLLVPKLTALLKKEKIDIPVIVGGVIPFEYESILIDAGVAPPVFPPDSDMDDIIRSVKEHARQGGKSDDRN